MNYQIGTSYNFNVYPAAILGNQFKNFKLTAVLDAETARLMQFDPAAMHAKVFPTLPDGSVDNYLSYSYLKFVTPTGEVAIIGEPWINVATVTTVSSDYLIAKISANQDNVQAVRAALLSNGFPVEAIQVGGSMSPT